ncbi:hypothetical protein G9A89_017009 [Geosiphon pyriformis]|nr:hypothetical protein G9A89_017009 [Geosiphon pyriformis]
MSKASSNPRDNYGEEETNQLLTTTPALIVPRERKRLIWIVLGAFLLSIVIIALVASRSGVSDVAKQKRNVILMISDGFGPASETFARSYYQFINDFSYNYTTPLDLINVGTSRTRSSNSLITDSAAGATAFSCAIKTYNLAVAVDPDQVPCGTILESAKAIGMATGLVVTSRVTHATPASFSAHATNRSMESEIAAQQVGDYPLGRQVDLIFGGGRCYFLANATENSCRTDNRDIVDIAKKRDFNYLTTRKEFDNIKITKDSLPILGLFTLDHMAYEIDRDPTTEPSLKEMSQKALGLLEKATNDSNQGFFLMIEGSRIDMAAHSNDAPAHVHDILAYYEAVAAVREYVDSHPGTVMISVSDHETGGLTVGRQTSSKYPEYLWYPDVIQRVKNSSFILADKLRKYDKSDRIDFIKNIIFRDSLGIDDFTNEDVAFLNLTEPSPSFYNNYIANMSSFRARLGWTTHGHSGVDVNLYAYGTDAERLYGNHENTEIGKFIVEFLGLDLTTITEELNKNNSSFHLSDHADISQFNVDHLIHYHH